MEIMKWAIGGVLAALIIILAHETFAPSLKPADVRALETAPAKGNTGRGKKRRSPALPQGGENIC